MSLRGIIGLEYQQKYNPNTLNEDIARRECAHRALFAEITALRDVCKFLLNGHKNHVIYIDDKPAYNITCIGGSTTRIKVTVDGIIDDYSVSDVIISRKTTIYTDDRTDASLVTFDITSAYMNGFSEAEMTEQLKSVYDLQEAMLIADGHISPDTEVNKEHYAA